jgi:hypothetical protein
MDTLQRYAHFDCLAPLESGILSVSFAYHSSFPHLIPLSSLGIFAEPSFIGAISIFAYRSAGSVRVV